MSKVFTIAEGLENLGALKTGGQGSIYKARRIGPITTAVKLMPTPILSEDMADKNYRDFRNEVEKLKKVNELPNPNVVRILSFGISETGSFPFIEMEFIDGPDLEDLLKPPHDPVFSIKETIRVAEHLASALAHCHRVDVKHGDIKSNNVKYNEHTGNYVLLDFGLALMSDEQRRTSLRRAGAVEFMAPEQSEGRLLFESDVYSYGVIIYELLAGQVPFLLDNRNETTRNLVLVAHMETAPPEILPLRSKHLPAAWPEDRRKHEMQVPQWLLDMVRKCMEKDPGKRFANGVEVYEYILQHSISVAQSSELTDLLQEENRKLKEENQLLQTQLRQAGTAAAAPMENYSQPAYNQPAPAGNSRKWMLPAAVATLAALAILFYVVTANRRSAGTVAGADTTITTTTAMQPRPLDRGENERAETEGNDADRDARSEDSAFLSTDEQTSADSSVEESQGGEQGQDDGVPLRVPTGRFLVNASRAYFHNDPDPFTRREAYLTPSDRVMTAIDEQGDFVYIVFTNDQGITSKGWVLRRELRPAE